MNNPRERARARGPEPRVEPRSPEGVSPPRRRGRACPDFCSESCGRGRKAPFRLPTPRGGLRRIVLGGAGRERTRRLEGRGSSGCLWAFGRAGKRSGLDEHPGATEDPRGGEAQPRQCPAGGLREPGRASVPLGASPRPACKATGGRGGEGRGDPDFSPSPPPPSPLRVLGCPLAPCAALRPPASGRGAPRAWAAPSRPPHRGGAPVARPQPNLFAPLVAIFGTGWVG